MGVPLTDEMILRIAGYDEWVEEIMQNAEKVAQEKQKEKEEQFKELEEENKFLKNPGGFPFAQGRPIPASLVQSNQEKEAVATADESRIYDRLNDEKLKVLKLLQEKIERLN
jgi:hypothetical protein